MKKNLLHAVCIIANCLLPVANCFSQAPAYLWAKSAGGNSDDWGQSISTDASGNVYVTGCFSSPSLTFGTTTLTNAGNYDIFIVKYDSNGNVLWVKNAGGTQSDWANGIFTDANGNVYVTGFFLSPSITFGTTTLTNADNTGATVDIFVAKIDRCTPEPPPICLVTVDSLSQNNIIVWDKTNFISGDTFFVYRDTANYNYALIGKVPYDSLSWFIDTARSVGGPNGGDPNASSWRYKLAVKDTCGSISEKSPFHQTVFMIQSGGNFMWTHYQIEGQPQPVPGLTNYLFLRDNFSTGNYQLVQTLSASSTLYYDAAYATYPNATWRVKTLWSTTCTPSIIHNPDEEKWSNPSLMGTINTSKSNTFKTSGNPGVNDNFLEHIINVYPNPNKGNFILDLQTLNSKFVKIKMYDMFGQLVYEKNSLEKKTEISCNLPKGIYQLKIETDLGRINKKIIIQ